MGLWSEIVIGSIVLFFIIYMSFVDIKNNMSNLLFNIQLKPPPTSTISSPLSATRAAIFLKCGQASLGAYTFKIVIFSPAIIPIM